MNVSLFEFKQAIVSEHKLTNKGRQPKIVKKLRMALVD